MSSCKYDYIKEFCRWCNWNGNFVFKVCDTQYIYDTPFTYYELFYNYEGDDLKCYCEGYEVVKHNGETMETFLNRLYGRDIWCMDKKFHFPSCFEELCIMNDLMEHQNVY